MLKKCPLECFVRLKSGYGWVYSSFGLFHVASYFVSKMRPNWCMDQCILQTGISLMACKYTCPIYPRFLCFWNILQFLHDKNRSHNGILSLKKLRTIHVEEWQKNSNNSQTWKCTSQHATNVHPTSSLYCSFLAT